MRLDLQLESFVLQNQEAALMLLLVVLIGTHDPIQGLGTYLLLCYPLVESYHRAKSCKGLGNRLCSLLSEELQSHDRGPCQGEI